MRGAPRAGTYLVVGLSLLATTACGAEQTPEQSTEPPATTEAETATTEGLQAYEATTPESTRALVEEIGSATEEENMALISAARRGDAREIRRLLERGASVDARDGSGQTALVAASYGNHLDAARVLIEAGADVNAKDETEQSAYLISTSEVGDDPRLLELTLENGADVRSLDSYYGTGLIRAAERGHVGIVGDLLETDVDVNHVNNLGWTALLEAIILGDGGPRHTEVVRLLVEGSADPNLADGNGVAPLGHARQRGYAEIAEILQSAGAQ